MEKVTETTAAPPLFRRHVRRPRLTALLDESTAQAIVMTAPAGYGKTVLAQEWLTGRPNVAWYRASPASADVAAFSVGVADAVAPIVPNAGDRLRQRLRVADTPEKLVRPLAELLGEDLAAWPDDAWLVVDDYHLVTDSTAVEEFVDWLLTLAPVHLLVTTRRRPSWASARRVLYGEITEIGRDQLAMTNEEASQVLDGRSSEAVRALVAQAEGWPALIGLAALSASSELPRERVSDALFRYFAEEVFRREPPEVQHFMLVASIPVSLNVELVRDVLGFGDAEPILQRLESDGLLHRADRGDARFHPLLRDFLRRKLDVDHPELVPRLRRGTLEYAQRLERWDEAFALALESGRPDKAAEVLGLAAPSLLASGQLETVEKWLSSGGPAFVSEPGPLLAKADLLIREGRFLEATAIARQVATSLEPDHPDLTRAWFLAGRASHLASQPEEALADHVRAKQAARRHEDLRNALWGAFVAASELELQDLGNYLNEFEAVVGDDIDSRLQIAMGRLNLASNRGTLKGAWPLIQAVAPFAPYSRDPMVRSSFLTSAAYLNIGRGEYSLAQRFASEAIDFCTRLNLNFATGYSLVQQCAAQIGLRQFRQARATLTRISQIGHSRDKYLRLEQLTHEAKLLLATGDPHAALATHERLPSTDQPPEPLGAYLGLMAIAAAAADQPADALSFAQQARAATSRVETHYYSHFAELLCQLRGDGMRSDVSGAAARLIGSAAQDEFLDAFVVAYRSCPRLLNAVRDVPFLLTPAATVIASANDEALARAAGVPLAGAGDSSRSPLPSLTRREREVLLLLTQGLSNGEIAKTLVISISTAKVHVRHILKKLGVRTRLEAVLAARDAGWTD